MRFVCPSCAAGNRVPDKAAGLTIICRRCKTQITIPGDPNRPTRSWITSPRWLGIIGLELVFLAGLAVTGTVLYRRQPPEDLPLVETAHDEPQVAVPGKKLDLAWETNQESAGGYYRLDSATVSLVSGRRPFAVGEPEATDKDWPADLLESENLPAPRPIVPSLTITIPEQYTLSGQRVTLQASVEVSFPAPAGSGGAPQVRTATLRHEQSFVVATESQGHAFASWAVQGRMLRWLAMACGAFVIGIPIGAGALAQQRVTLKCPQCSRTTEVTFYHDGGDFYMSPCPHRGNESRQAYD